MKIALDSGGSYLEPDDGPRNTRYHMGILHAEPIPNTRSGNRVTLACGHVVQTFGNLTYSGGRILCTKCRDLEESESGSL